MRQQMTNKRLKKIIKDMKIQTLAEIKDDNNKKALFRRLHLLWRNPKKMFQIKRKLVELQEDNNSL